MVAVAAPACWWRRDRWSWCTPGSGCAAWRGERGMHHRLLVAGLVVGQRSPTLLQGLPQAAHVAVAEAGGGMHHRLARCGSGSRAALPHPAPEPAPGRTRTTPELCRGRRCRRRRGSAAAACHRARCTEPPGTSPLPAPWSGVQLPDLRSAAPRICPMLPLLRTVATVRCPRARRQTTKHARGGCARSRLFRRTLVVPL